MPGYKPPEERRKFFDQAHPVMRQIREELIDPSQMSKDPDNKGAVEQMRQWANETTKIQEKQRLHAESRFKDKHLSNENTQPVCCEVFCLAVAVSVNHAIRRFCLRRGCTVCFAQIAISFRLKYIYFATHFGHLRSETDLMVRLLRLLAVLATRFFACCRVLLLESLSSNSHRFKLCLAEITVVGRYPRAALPTRGRGEEPD